MATQISRDILNEETNARFWSQTGYRPGQKLDPNNPTDKAMMPVWMDVFRKVQREANAGTLVTTYDRPEVAQPLSDAEVANIVIETHVDAATKAPDPTTAQQHFAAAATASQISTQKAREAAANQPPTVSPQLQEAAAREAAMTPPPPQAPAADHIAHAQTQNGQFLRPEEDPWDSRYVPKSKSPREQSPAQPSRPPRAQPPREVLTKETNERFWNRTQFKRGQKLDMSIPEDRRQARIWMEIFGEVQREANEGRLTFTNPDLAPAPNGVRPPYGARPPSRPMPPMQQPMPPGMQPWPPPGMQPGMPTPGAPSIPTEAAPLLSFPTEDAPTTQPTEGGALTTEPTTESAPAEGMSTKAKIALGVLGLGGLAGIVYAVTRKPAGRAVSFRPRARMSSAVMSSSAFPPSRGGRF